MEESDRRQFLRDEYLFLQAQYEDYDKRSLTIKGWVGTGAIASLAFSSAALPFSWFVPFSIMTLAIIFWYLEAYWKMFQYALSDRIRIIEAYFRNDEEVLIQKPDPFQIYNFWFRSYAYDEPIFPYEKLKKIRPKPYNSRLASAAFQRFVCLPYLPIIILSAVNCVHLFFK